MDSSPQIHERQAFLADVFDSKRKKQGLARLSRGDSMTDFVRRWGP